MIRPRGYVFVYRKQARKGAAMHFVPMVKRDVDVRHSLGLQAALAPCSGDTGEERMACGRWYVGRDRVLK